MLRDSQISSAWRFFWLSTSSRPTLVDALLLDMRKEALAQEEVELLAMRVVETIRRLSREELPRRIDLRPIARGTEIGLQEIRWDHRLGRRRILLRLFVAQPSEAKQRIGIRFFAKRVLPDLAGTNHLQDLAIDDSIREYFDNHDSNLLEIS